MSLTFRRFRHVALAAGIAVTAGACGAQAAALVVAPDGAVGVPCDVGTLNTYIRAAVSGEVLYLADNCTYTLTSALDSPITSLTIESNGTATIARSTATGTADFSILTLDTAGIDVTVQKVNFRNGSSASYGGAIYDERGSLTVNGGKFSANYATEAGGAIYGAQAVTVKNAVFHGNSVGGVGGALAVNDSGTLQADAFTDNNAGAGGGAVWSSGITHASSSTFTGNATSGVGGAIYGVVGTLTLTDFSISHNSATLGGGVMSYVTTTMNSGSFTSNGASEGGGGVYAQGSVTVANAKFIGNSSGSMGGGLASFATAKLSSLTFQGNTADYGGGLFSGGAFTMNNGSFVDNTANSGGGLFNAGRGSATSIGMTGNNAVNYGGGIYNGNLSTGTGLSPTLTVTGGHIALNSATRDGGGIDNDAADGGTVTLAHTSVTSNTPDDCILSSAIAGCAG
jgi:predicted outer membrane repeat protein